MSELVKGQLTKQKGEKMTDKWTKEDTKNIAKGVGKGLIQVAWLGIMIPVVVCGLGLIPKLKDANYPLE